MNCLFIHQNFPGQYLHLARYLAETGHTVVAITQRSDILIERVRIHRYIPDDTDRTPHKYLHEVSASVLNGVAVARICEELNAQGFKPDVIVGHSGWGEILYVKDVWPLVPLLGYFEFYYRATGSDADFDHETAAEPDMAMRLRTRNAINLMGLEAADWGQTATHWQQSLYPEGYRSRISVVHEGVDTGVAKPEPTAGLWLKGGTFLSRNEPVITYSARNLEPYRGFHVFLRALPGVLRKRPDAHVVIVGGDDVSYGRQPSRAPTWREELLAELDGEFDLRRVHFVGRLPYRQYLAVLQLSSVHVYMTYPFVLSWSLLEAMACGCHIVASRTPPVEEVIRDHENGWLFDFFDTDALSDRLLAALENGRSNSRLRNAARMTAVDGYDLQTVCLPAQLELLRRLAGARQIAPRRTDNQVHV